MAPPRDSTDIRYCGIPNIRLFVVIFGNVVDPRREDKGDEIEGNIRKLICLCRDEIVA